VHAFEVPTKPCDAKKDRVTGLRHADFDEQKFDGRFEGMG
jgi:hypothetical protein